MKRQAAAIINISNVAQDPAHSVQATALHKSSGVAFMQSKHRDGMAGFESHQSNVMHLANRSARLQHEDPESHAVEAMFSVEELLSSNHVDGNVVRVKAAGLAEAPEAVALALYQHTTVDGVITKIVSCGNATKVTFRDIEGKVVEGDVVDASQVRALSRHLLSETLRVHGDGKWTRSAAGNWKLDSFMVQSFETLDDSPLDEVLQQLQDLPGNGWAELENPLNAWRAMRGAEDHL